jgi:ABC-type transport system involved in cytochrome c biogenesis permease subunit
MDRVNTVCFLASYALALAFEVLHQLRPRPVFRLLALAGGTAGLVAQTAFLDIRRPPLAGRFGWLVLLSWILAIFYLAGSLHHRRQAWGVFVLPVILGLLGLALFFRYSAGGTDTVHAPQELLWGPVHGWLVFLATVGVSIGFLASVMYLIQARRLRAKALPGQGPRMLSLERLEAMNRRAIDLAFPLLTAGLVLGALLMFQDRLPGWSDPRVVGAAILWVTFALLLYLRYGRHLRGRQVAVWTIVTFVLLMGCAALSHPLGQGGGR